MQLETNWGICADNITAKYGSETIIANLSTCLPKGKINAIVGPNGCGKSTFLKIIGGLLSNFSGNVKIDGEKIEKLRGKALARKVASLSQCPIIPEGYTVKELVSLGRYSHRSLFGSDHKDKELINFALDEMDLHPMSNRQVISLSGGQRQKVWLAMALAQDTPYLLLDEPTTYLDIARQFEMLALLKHLNEEHDKTIIMVLHDINQAMHYAHNILLMGNKQGILAEGVPSEVLTPSAIEHAFSLKVKMLQDYDTGKSHIVVC